MKAKIVTFILFLLVCNPNFGQRYIPPAPWVVFNNETRPEAAIYEHKDSAWLMQVIDLRYMEVDLIQDGVVDMNYNLDGLNYPTSPNPNFSLIDHERIFDIYSELYGEKYFSIMNAVYLHEVECYQSAKFSYPVKIGGTIVSGGGALDSSDYLKAITFKNIFDEANIEDFESSTGFPLNHATINDGFVMLNPFYEWFFEKYPIIGLLDIDNDLQLETMLIIFNREPGYPKYRAGYLRDSLSVNPAKIILLDGGNSLFLAGKEKYIEPGPADCIGLQRDLNFYLGFRVKGQTDEDKKIEILNPNFIDIVYKSEPYLITWRDNIEGNVKIDLFKKNSFLQTITSSTASDGIFRWTPSSSLASGDDYKIRVSWSNQIGSVYDFSEEFIIYTGIVNGDFEDGNTGFSSEYIYNENIANEGYYSIESNPNDWHSGFAECEDHTPWSENDKMMVVNGATTDDPDYKIVWHQSVDVLPLFWHNLNFWATSLLGEETPNPAILRVVINEEIIGEVTLDPTTCEWQNIHFSWFAEYPITNADIYIYDIRTSAGGNDFAIDDISFFEDELQKENVADEKVNISKAYSFDIKNFPNPFNPSTKITYSIPEPDLVRLTVYDILGREVSLLINEQKNAGEYSVTFNADNLPSGIYFYRLETTRNVKTDKMLLLK